MIEINGTTAKRMNLVLYLKRGSKKIKKNWMMHEYSLVNPSSSTGHVSRRKNGFVFCRIYRKGSSDEENATLEGDAASPASTDFSRSNEDLPPSPVEIPSDPAAAIQDSSDFSWRVEDLEDFLRVFSESNAAPAAGSSDFHSNNEDLTALLPEIPSELAAVYPGSPDFSWKEEDLAALLAGWPALC